MKLILKNNNIMLFWGVQKQFSLEQFFWVEIKQRKRLHFFSKTKEVQA